jgi:hypothetical protein
MCDDGLDDRLAAVGRVVKTLHDTESVEWMMHAGTPLWCCHSHSAAAPAAGSLVLVLGACSPSLLWLSMVMMLLVAAYLGLRFNGSQRRLRDSPALQACHIMLLFAVLYLPLLPGGLAMDQNLDQHATPT